MNPACQKIWQTQSARRLMRRNGSFIDLYGIIGRALSKEQQHIFANTKGAEATVSFHDFEIKDRFVELARAAHPATLMQVSTMPRMTGTSHGEAFIAASLAVLTETNYSSARRANRILDASCR